MIFGSLLMVAGSAGAIEIAGHSTAVAELGDLMFVVQARSGTTALPDLVGGFSNIGATSSQRQFSSSGGQDIARCSIRASCVIVRPEDIGRSIPHLNRVILLRNSVGRALVFQTAVSPFNLSALKPPGVLFFAGVRSASAAGPGAGAVNGGAPNFTEVRSVGDSEGFAQTSCSSRFSLWAPLQPGAYTLTNGNNLSQGGFRAVSLQ